MIFCVGDLVKSRHDEHGIGVIVESRLSVGTSSTHMQHMRDIYPNVYYVYFSKWGKLGPYYSGELEKISQAIES